MAVPMSDVPTTVEIPAQRGAVVGLAAGHRLRIIDVEGSQVGDLFAVSASDRNEWLSASATRGRAGRMFPAVGQSFVSNAWRPLLTFERDDSPGVHEMLAAPCSPEMYRALGCGTHHPSCSENFRTAAAQADWQPIHVPDPVNFFQLTATAPDGAFTYLPAPTKAGDSVTLRAETDLYVVVTACSMDIEPINGDHCTPLRLEVFR